MISMFKYLNFKLIALILLSFVSGCAHYGQSVSQGTKVKGEQPQGEPYLTARSDAYYHFIRSRQLLYQNRVKEALAELELATAADPEDPYLFSELASFYLRQGEGSKALAAAERARNLDPSSIKVRMMLGGLYSSLNQPKLAIAEYKEVLKLNPSEQKSPCIVFAQQQYC